MRNTRDTGLGPGVRRAGVADLPYLVWLQQRECYAIGFIPQSAYADILTLGPVRRWHYSEILLAVDAADPTGFCYWSWAGRYAHIFQICIQADARRWEHATRLLEQVEAQARALGCQGVLCRVAQDLESNRFWTALGYQCVGTARGRRKGSGRTTRPLWQYLKPFLPLFEYGGRHDKCKVERRQ